jgi:hypothetical protein
VTDAGDILHRVEDSSQAEVAEDRRNNEEVHIHRRMPPFWFVVWVVEND